MATAQQVANNIETLSPEHRIIRFLGKAWRNRANTNYVNAVKKVLTDGQIDKAKLRALFVAREICTSEEFDSAVTHGVQAGVLTADLKETGVFLLDVFDIIEARVVLEQEEKEAQWNASHLFNNHTKAEYDVLKLDYPARVAEIISELENA